MQYQNQHSFHIPVMGTGHSIDSPIRVAHLGINSVISVVDDLLLEKIRKYYCQQFDRPYRNIPRTAEDGRARRVAAWLDLVAELVQERFEQIKNLPLFERTEKDRYFRLLPEQNPLRQAYENLAGIDDQTLLEDGKRWLTAQMKPGQVEVNIMAKVDALRLDGDDRPLSQEYSDANSALRGVANSLHNAPLVLSAGFNPRLYSYLEQFRAFYRDAAGEVKNKIVLKVSDFRSALIQGKFLAKKGLEVSEFRIESGLNCGGHAFPSDGVLMPVLLREFREKRQQLAETFAPLIRSYYESQGWEWPVAGPEEVTPAVTVQGGIGTGGERERLIHEYGMDSTGWGSPFLLVPEATCVDEETSRLLSESGEEAYYLSGVSPLGVPFNNIRGSGAQIYTKAKAESDKPGSKCPKGYLVSNTEFTENPICTASTQYQLLKLDQIDRSEIPDDRKEREREKILEKSCLCENLGSGALIRLGLRKPSYGRQEICPGPNLAWFDRHYSLDEMVDHIYGRRPSLVPSERPHMFAKELVMYVDWLLEQYRQADEGETGWKKMEKILRNLEAGMEECLHIADSDPYGDENLESIRQTVREQKERLAQLTLSA